MTPEELRERVADAVISYADALDGSAAMTPLDTADIIIALVESYITEQEMP